ncbi:LacI family DNA-binding transcriptional regulator [Faecalicatena contorta]|uniref:Transcriptional regulator, LacI family n=1 Tax=Faecalicatena contorta TaxID=39482 RepID=A0A315ZUI1_9FIRM|nr:LacI family DNA-binding transcriptional regulator [Faecalicatena contorta]MBA4700643.1 LacI family DNA-binding transcriptional regulator [Ruminococcus sp.]PWJ48982.1 LacI family transcriptional regulator [Faecalicatena contorta]SUQ15072.1 transcriptional regulator, LacI family [Faecalicatena contorta]
MDQNITIEDVAKLAGVSRATAGRVVGGYGNTSEKSREKVLQAVKELNYRPNLVAQGLRGQSTKTIAVILGSIKNNYCNHLIYAVEKEAQKKGYNVIICNTHEDIRQEIRHLQNMYSRQVDGIVMMSACRTDEEIEEQYKELYSGETPIVFVDRKIKGLTSCVIQSNNELASYEATKYLLELGHQRIGILATEDYSTVNERIKGYKRALEENGIVFNPKNIQFAAQSEKNKVAEMTAKLLREKSQVTAIYVLNNSLCAGVLSELKRQKKNIPEDISLLVWDDEDLNELLEITTVVQPIEEIGKMAINKLIHDMRTKKGAEESTKEILDSHIIYRSSCKKVNS